MYQVLKIIYGLATFIATAATLTASPKSVNVALETSLLFEPKDSDQHLKFLRSFRDILDRLEQALQPDNRALRTNEPYKGILTNFVHDLVKTISKFRDLDLQSFFTNLESEMRNHFYKGSVFREIVYDPKLQTYIRNILKEWANADPRKMKAKLRMYIGGDMNKNNTSNRLLTFLNDYFNSEDDFTMKDILYKLGDPESNFPSVIKEMLDYFIFEHYDKMNYTARAKFADEINKLSDVVDTQTDKDLKLTFRKSSDDMGSEEPINSGKEKSKDIIKAKDPKEQLVLNKDVEIFVKALDASEESNERDEDAVNELRNNISSDNNDFLNNLKNGD